MNIFEKFIATALVAATCTVAAVAASAQSGFDKPGSANDNVPGLTEALELKLDPSRISFSRAKYLPLPPEGSVTVQLLGTAINAAIPGKFKFHLAAEEASDLFTTVSVPAGNPFPKGVELVDGIAFVEPGKWYTLQVVYENPTDRRISFYVSAPTIDPEVAFPFARALCWCAAVPFTAPAGGAFYRTIKVGVSINTPPGARVIVDWPVVMIADRGGMK
jgi:hypothetical protein